MIKRMGNYVIDGAEKKSHSAGRRYPDMIGLVSGSRTSKIIIDEIEVVEQDGRKLHIITAEKDYVCNESIETVAGLLSDKGFYRAMKKIMLNFDRVVEINRKEIVFISGATLMIGRNNLIETRKAFKAYILAYPSLAGWEKSSDNIKVAENEENIIG